MLARRQGKPVTSRSASDALRLLGRRCAVECRAAALRGGEHPSRTGRRCPARASPHLDADRDAEERVVEVKFVVPSMIEHPRTRVPSAAACAGIPRRARRGSGPVLRDALEQQRPRSALSYSGHEVDAGPCARARDAAIALQLLTAPASPGRRPSRFCSTAGRERSRFGSLRSLRARRCAGRSASTGQSPHFALIGRRGELAGADAGRGGAHALERELEVFVVTSTSPTTPEPTKWQRARAAAPRVSRYGEQWEPGAARP